MDVPGNKKQTVEALDDKSKSNDVLEVSDIIFIQIYSSIQWAPAVFIVITDRWGLEGKTWLNKQLFPSIVTWSNITGMVTISVHVVWVHLHGNCKSIQSHSLRLHPLMKHFCSHQGGLFQDDGGPRCPPNGFDMYENIHFKPAKHLWEILDDCVMHNATTVTKIPNAGISFRMMFFHPSSTALRHVGSIPSYRSKGGNS